jgi:hypothetical protein
MINSVGVGQATVFIGEDHGEHSVEQLAEMMLTKLIVVAGQAPQPVRDQLWAFRLKAKELFLQYLREAQAIERRKMINGN